MSKKLSKNNSLLVRSAFVMFFVLLCSFVAMLSMGKAYTQMQKVLFNNETEAFYIVDKDVFSFFGKEYYIPIITVIEKAIYFFKNFAWGIIKLIGYALNLTNELVEKVIKFFVK